MFVKRRYSSRAFMTPLRRSQIGNFGCIPVATRNKNVRGRPRIRSHRKHPSDPSMSHFEMRVVVRVRPENYRELSDCRFRNVVEILDEKTLVFDPDIQDYDGVIAATLIQKPAFRGMKKERKNATYTFDQVFGPEATSEDVYRGTTYELIEAVMEGYNCSVFAYGATASGKTFTMLGSDNCPGIAYYTAHELFRRVAEVKDHVIYDIKVSYLEIYNENLYDLLNKNSGALDICESGKDQLVITPLSRLKASSPHELLQMMRQGNAARTQHPTELNTGSSRSHAVFLIYVRQQELTSTGSSDVKLGMMTLVDLAGSEKVSATGPRNARFREGSNINKSLLALWNCIDALARGSLHVPFRTSKLTRILKEALGGNCRSVMVANISPSSAQYEETQNTLNYAYRAKSMKTTVTKNVMITDAHPSMVEYWQIIDDLKKENTALKEENRILKGEKDVLVEKLQAEWEGRLQSEKEKWEMWKSEYEVRLKEERAKMKEYKKKWNEEISKREGERIMLDPQRVGDSAKCGEEKSDSWKEEMAKRKRDSKKWKEEKTMWEEEKAKWKEEKAEWEEEKAKWKDERAARKEERRKWKEMRAEWEEERAEMNEERAEWEEERAKRKEERAEWEENRMWKKRAEWEEESNVELYGEEDRERWEEEGEEEEISRWREERAKRKEECCQLQEERAMWEEERAEFEENRARKMEERAEWEEERAKRDKCRMWKERVELGEERSKLELRREADRARRDEEEERSKWKEERAKRKEESKLQEERVKWEMLARASQGNNGGNPLLVKEEHASRKREVSMNSFM